MSTQNKVGFHLFPFFTNITYDFILRFMRDRLIFHIYNVHNMMNDSKIGFKPISFNSKDAIYFSIEFMSSNRN
jgi:hypothetical protein